MPFVRNKRKTLGIHDIFLCLFISTRNNGINDFHLWMRGFQRRVKHLALHGMRLLCPESCGRFTNHRLPVLSTGNVRNAGGDFGQRVVLSSNWEWLLVLTLTLSMLRLLLFVQSTWMQTLSKPPKPCHVGTH